MPNGVALPSIQHAFPSNTARTERLLASPPAPTGTSRWRCPAAKARRYAASRPKVATWRAFSGFRLRRLVLAGMSIPPITSNSPVWQHQSGDILLRLLDSHCLTVDTKAVSDYKNQSNLA